MTYYILDHYYALDHMDYCRVVQSGPDKSMYDIAEICTAIRFYFEENVSESDNPELDDVVTLMEKAYGFKACDKDAIRDAVARILEQEQGIDYASYELYDYGGDTYVYLDLYEVRECLCGPGQPEKLFRKWLTPEMMDGIKKMRLEQ